MGVWEKMTDDNDRGGEATSNPQDPHLLRWTFPFPPCQNLYGLTIQISKKSEISEGGGVKPIWEFFLIFSVFL